MRDKEQAARSILGGAVRELEQASKELVELLGKLPEHHSLFATFSANPEISVAWERCREKLQKKSRAFKAWQESLSKGPW